MLVQSIASYDIWDTVLRRRCHPDTVKVHVARLLMLLAGECVKPHLRDPWILFHYRQNAERSIGQDAQRHGFDDEYLIEDVFERWLDTVTDATAVLPDDLVATLVRAEIEQEKSIIYKDPTIEGQFRADASTRRIFVSDFYMSKSQLVELLESVGLQDYFDFGYVSCEVRLNKRSGRLFNHVLEAEGVTPAQVRHWGDNLHSDVNMPASLGIECQHYVPAEEHAMRAIKEQRFHERGATLRDLTSVEQVAKDGVRKIANRSAPLFIGFMLYVQEQILRQGLERIFFFTREGEFFLKIYETLRAGSPFSDRLPRGELIEVSRIATFGPSLKELSAAEMMRVWNLYSTQSPRAMLKTLDLPVEEFGRFFTNRGMELDTPIQYPWLHGPMIELFGDAEFRSLAESRLAQRRALFLKYCAQRGLDESVSRCGVVDIGWRGTIQDNIACMMPTTHFSGFYLGLSKLLNVQPPNASKHAYGPDLNVLDTPSARDLLRFVAPIEMLTNSASGSVVGYEFERGAVVARRLVNSAENAVHEKFTHAFQQYIVDTARRHAAALIADATSSDEYRPAALNTWRELILRPNEEIARAYFSLVHNETFGLGKFVEKADGLGRFWVLRLLLSPRYRKQFRQRLSALGWTSGYAVIKKDRFLLPILNAFYTK